MDDQPAIQDVVAATLKEMGLGAAFVRTVLIQDGFFVGHKYRFHEGGHAVWRAEKNVIEVYNDDGNLLKTVGAEQRKAV